MASRPDDAVGIVVLLDRRGDHPRYADAVTAHEHRQGFALFIEHAGVHGRAIELSELEYVPHLDAAGNLQLAPSRRTGIALLDIADIDRRLIGEIAAPIHAAVVHVFFIGAAYEIGQVCRCVIDVNAPLEANADR